LLESIQKLIIKKTHGGTEVWCIQHRSLIIDAKKLTKYRRWLLVIICIITLILIKNFFAMHHLIQFLDRREFTRPNINVLIKKWMPSDMLCAPRFTSFEYVMRPRRSEEYIFEMIELENFWSIVMILELYGNSKLGVVVKMVIEKKHEFLFGTYVR